VFAVVGMMVEVVPAVSSMPEKSVVVVSLERL